MKIGDTPGRILADQEIRISPPLATPGAILRRANPHGPGTTQINSKHDRGLFRHVTEYRLPCGTPRQPARKFDRDIIANRLYILATPL